MINYIYISIWINGKKKLSIEMNYRIVYDAFVYRLKIRRTVQTLFMNTQIFSDSVKYPWTNKH